MFENCSRTVPITRKMQRHNSVKITPRPLLIFSLDSYPDKIHYPVPKPLLFGRRAS
jgi:hypothetical protein